jgi:iron complex transport system substrate-binding protein
MRAGDHDTGSELGHGTSWHGPIAEERSMRQDEGVRIVSLLPSATEITFALGLGDDLVGVTHECDWPEAAMTKRVVSHTTIPTDASPAEVDRLVSASMTGGEPTYRLDELAVRELAPDLVLTQDLCAVCAVPAGQVHQALDVLGCPAQVLSLDPSSLDEVFDGVLAVGQATGTRERAEALIHGLRARLEAVARAVTGRAKPRVFALEWGDPPFNGGHWVPEMIERAGGEPVLAAPGTPSVRVTWAAIEAAAPDIVVFMPCGYNLPEAVTEGAALRSRPEFAGVKEFYAVHSNAYFSRPGPRLVDGVEALAEMLQPGSGVAAPEGSFAPIP